MRLISYKEFAKLRIQDFYPMGTAIDCEDSGIECSLGAAGCAGVAGTYFAWPPDRPGETGEVCLDFRKEYNGCPPEISKNILDTLKLPLVPGMTKDEILRLLGQPARVLQCPNGVLSLAFLCNESSESEYFVDCDIHPGLGLIGVTVVREDMREH